MESTFCDVMPSEKANCAFVSATSMSFRHEGSTMPRPAASDEPDSIARRKASFTMRCKCGASDATSMSCWIALMIVLCTWRERNAFKASVWKSCASLLQSGWPRDCGGLRARFVGPNKSRRPSHDALSWSSALLRVFAARALLVHQPAIACLRWHHAAAHTSSSFIRWTSSQVAPFVRVLASVSGPATSKEACW